MNNIIKGIFLLLLGIFTIGNVSATRVLDNVEREYVNYQHSKLDNGWFEGTLSGIEEDIDYIKKGVYELSEGYTIESQYYSYYISLRIKSAYGTIKEDNYKMNFSTILTGENKKFIPAFNTLSKYGSGMTMQEWYFFLGQYEKIDNQLLDAVMYIYIQEMILRDFDNDFMSAVNYYLFFKSKREGTIYTKHINKYKENMNNSIQGKKRILR